MNEETFKKIDSTLKKLEEKNKTLLKKTIPFGIWFLISGFIFITFMFAMLNVYASAGFEKTLIIILIAMLFTQGNAKIKSFY